MNLDPYSRYNLAPIIIVQDTTGRLVEPPHLGQRPTLTNTSFADNTLYRPKSGERWTQIAYRLLGDGSYYWAIADCTGVLDVFDALEPRTTYGYVAQLSVSLSAGVVSSATLTRTRKITNNTVLKITDLDTPANEIVVRVQTVNLVTGVITFPPVTCPGAISAARSRVGKAIVKDAVVIVPSAHRFRFDLTDFGNQLNVAEP